MSVSSELDPVLTHALKKVLQLVRATLDPE